MRWLEARCSCRRKNARPRRADRHWQRVRRQPRLGGSGRRTLVVSFHQRGRAIVGRPARRGSDAVKAVRERRAQDATDQAVRLGAQELRPAGADPPRRRPQARATQHGRDRGRRDADPQPPLAHPGCACSPSWGSRASRVIRLRVSAASGGRPSLRGRGLRYPCSSALCHRRSVCGLIAKEDHRSGGTRRLAAASKARSALVYCGRFPPRLRIASWWRSTMSSSSRSRPARTSTRTRPHRSR
jgi:hypothetical protein